MAISQRRSGVDACPGAIDVHQAADGGLARVRLPGGWLTNAQLRVLARAALELGDGVLELTSRGNVQVRGLGVGASVELGARLGAAGLLPSMTHEKVRNIMSSPLAGPGLAAELDAGLCARPALAELPGRFLFALDDGRGDVAWLGADIATLPVGDGVAVLLGGVDHGIRVAASAVVPMVLACAEAFLEVRDGEWRVAELSGSRIAALIARAINLTAGTGLPATTDSPATNDLTAATDSTTPATAAGFVRNAASPPPLSIHNPHPPPGAGRLGQFISGGSQPSEKADKTGQLLTGGRTVHRSGVRVADLVQRVDHVPPPIGPVVFADGTPGLGAAARLGRLTAEQALAIAGDVVVTPWRGLVLVDSAAPDGLITDPDSPWIGVTACTGQPGCAKALADVRADARPLGRPAHWSGCARRCGRPAADVIDVVATENGYLGLEEVEGLES